MKIVIRLSIIVMLIAAFTYISFAQAVEIAKEEWQKQVTALTSKTTELKGKLDNLQKEVEGLQKQEVDKVQAMKLCDEELTAIMGPLKAPYLEKLDAIDSRISELSKLNNQDLWARRAELDEIQKLIDSAQKDPLSVVQKFQDRLKNQQGLLDGLKKTLDQINASGEIMPTYTVGTWAVNRDCLWNIAKKPKIYDNAFLWPKIWQGNRDQIKNPDVIHPGQKLKIPPKASLTKEEKKALNSYWSKKREKAAAVNP
jgi:nucleoid-associated protein YgaU